MKKFIIILFVLTFLYKSDKAQSFEWTARAGRYSFDLGYAVGTDNAGNVYISGKYERNAYFGGTYVSCAGNHDIYIAKYSSTGAFKWVRTAGGIGGDYTHGMCVDGAGNSYITGEYEHTTHFGTIELVSRGNNDVYVAKYDTNGNLIWVRNLGGSTSNDRGLAITLSNNNLYIAGRFMGSADFAGTKLVTSGGVDIFVAKYTTDGVFQWAKKAGGSGDDEGLAISNDKTGNFYVTGTFSNTASFSGTSITSSGGTDIFLAKYDTNGNLLFVKKAGGSDDDFGMGIKVDSMNRLFLTGSFRVHSTFGSLSMTAPLGHSDVFIACYDSSGNSVWVRQAGGPVNDAGRAIALDKSSNIYITGNFALSATFGPKTITGLDSTELFFASYDASGNFRWVLQAGGGVDASDPNRFIEMGLSIATDQSGNVFASGTYRSSSTFGSTTLSPWSTHTDIFLTKIRQVKSATETIIDATITPSGTVTYCTGGNVLLKTGDDPAYGYAWKKDGVIIKESTGASCKANSPGSYSVTIINGTDSVTSEPTLVTLEPCPESDNASGNLTNVNSLGTREDSLLVKIYPNPNNGLFTIEINMAQTAEQVGQAKVEMVNAIGQVVYLKMVSINNGYINEHIELENSVSTGIYFLQVTVGNNVEKTRMMLCR